MATRSVNAAAGVILALDSARLLNSPQQAAEHEQLRNDITGACLARWEEEQDNARLRLALASAQRGRQELRARVAELEELLVAKDRPVDEDPIAHALTDKATALEENVEPQVRRLRALLAGQREDAAAEADGITRRIAPTQALREETRAAQ
ncbi:hypothetical protein ACFC5H_09065 [Streptomyces rochei]